MSLFVFTAALIAAATDSAFVEKPCRDKYLAAIARCGTVNVPEDRQRPQKRTIALNVIVLPATSPGSLLPPLFDIDGGPGLPGTKNAEFYATFGSAYRAQRDVVTIDQRGTGGSNPLHCPELSRPEGAYQPLFPAAAVSRCRRSLEGNSDLTKFGTSEAVADLDDVRDALGYEKIDLFGFSYGTTVALRYLATYPDRVRAAVLMGVSPASATPPKVHAAAGERAIQLLFAQCRADAVCSASFDPQSDVERVRSRLPSIAGAPPVDIFFEKLRSLMYQPLGARQIPFILNAAALGDLRPFYEATRPSGPSLHADGMYLSVICSEGMALLDFAAESRYATATVFGDYRLRRQKEACAEWPAASVGADHVRPVQSAAPVLLISGELDPVTPPYLADEAAKTLRNSKHLVIPASGHVFDGMSGIDTCLDPIIRTFLDTGEIKSISFTCVAEMKPPPFVTKSSSSEKTLRN